MTQQLHSSRFIPEKRNLGSHKNLYMNIHSFFLNDPKLETAQMTFDRWMVKQIVVQKHCGIRLNNKKKQTIDTSKQLDWITLNKKKIQY